MLEKYSIKFKVNKINNLKKGLDVLNSTNNYTNFEADKKAVMDYSFNFVLKLMNSGSSLLDMFKVNMEPQIQELGEEILADKENVKNQEALNKALNDEEPLNNIQKDIYGTNEAKEAVNEKVRKRNILINDYKNPREGLKNYLLEKFMPIMYLNLDLGELADAIIDNDINYFNNHKEEIANIDSTIFADIYSDIYSEEY